MILIADILHRAGLFVHIVLLTKLSITYRLKVSALRQQDKQLHGVMIDAYMLRSPTINDL